MTTQFIPPLDEFAELAKHGNVIPIFAEFIADGETPVQHLENSIAAATASFLSPLKRTTSRDAFPSSVSSPA